MSVPDYSRLPLEDLAKRCTEQTELFHRREPNDTCYCYELWRRALVDRQEQAFDSVYVIYEDQVRRWVYSHTWFYQVDESIDHFVSAAFTSLYFALQGDKFAQFDSVPQVLAYLKRCVHTAIAEYLRKLEADTVPFPDNSPPARTPGPSARIEIQEMWQHICNLLPLEKDRLLAHCMFILDMKPLAIVAEFPQHWESPRQVAIHRYRIRQALRRDPDLRDWAGVSDAGNR